MNGELKEFLEEAANRGHSQPVRLTVRDLLAKWHAHRRGFKITQQIKADLDAFKLVSAPDFVEAWIDEEIALIPYAKAFDSPGLITSDEVASAPERVGSLRVRSLKSANNPVTSVNPNSSLAEAQSLMILNDYSQLAVTAGPRSLKGSITWESIAKAKVHDPTCDLSSAVAPIEPPLRLEDDLLLNVPRIVSHGFLFVTQEDNTLCGIVTTADLSEEFLQLAQPFFLIGEIEQRLRRAIDEAFDASELASLAIQTPSVRAIQSADDLTIGQYLDLLGRAENWAKIAWPGVDRKTFISYLDDVREIRNDVVHFSPDPLSDDQLRLLRNFVRWLRFVDPRP